VTVCPDGWSPPHYLITRNRIRLTGQLARPGPGAWPSRSRSPPGTCSAMIAGEKAPDFTLYDHTGRPRTLSALLSDGPVVLFFFPIASSPICTAQACHFRDL